MINEQVVSNLSSIPLRAVHHPLDLVANSPIRELSPLHMHSEIELLYIECGEFCCTAGGRDYIAKPGDTIYIASRVPHSTRSMVPGTNTAMLQFSAHNFLGTNKTLSNYLYRFINLNEVPIHLFRQGTEESDFIKNHIFSICRELGTRETGFENFMQASIFAILGLLYRSHILLSPETFFNLKYVERVLPALTYIDQNYSESISLEFLGKMMNINPVYFCRLFHQATNATFTEYLNFVRVCKSEKLLTTTALSISDISVEVGFSSLSYFNRIFKRCKGCSPSDYRKISYVNQ